jgi:phosphoglycerate dehydrogenase-like enzyme
MRVVNSEWYEDPTARAGLFFSALWTDQTAAQTAFTLGTAGTGAIGSRAIDFLTKGYGFKI